jgi:MFS family permease
MARRSGSGPIIGLACRPSRIVPAAQLHTPVPALRNILLPLVSLLSGVGMLVVGSGLLFSAVGLQTGAARFSPVVTGLIMSAYFAGFVLGTYLCPLVIRSVGHIRAFAAMASIASTLPILHALWLNAWYWGAMRLLTGICLVGLFIVVESWLAMLAQPHQRGRVFGLYMAVNGVALALGQWLILVGDKLGFTPFALVSILFSFALVPITLTPVADPQTGRAPSVSLRELVAISPIGVAGAIGSGLLSGALLSLGHVFGLGVGFSDIGVATFMAVTILGGALFQWPVGHLSDRNDRRWVLFWVCVACSAVASLGFVLARDYEASLMFLGVVYGGLAFTIYGLSVAHVNDMIDARRVLEVTGGLLLLHGIGATVGPTLAGSVMHWFGPESLMLYFAAVLAVLALTVWQFARGKAVLLATDRAPSDYVMMGDCSPAALRMDPRRAVDETGLGSSPDSRWG